MTVRCKFTCNEIVKRKGWKNSAGEEVPFVYDAKFSVVTGGSDEDKSFFAATPSGSLSVGTLRDDFFEVGASYYLDITKAEPEIKVA